MEKGRKVSQVGQEGERDGQEGSENFRRLGRKFDPTRPDQTPPPLHLKCQDDVPSCSTLGETRAPYRRSTFAPESHSRDRGDSTSPSRIKGVRYRRGLAQQDCSRDPRWYVSPLSVCWREKKLLSIGVPLLHQPFLSIYNADNLPLFTRRARCWKGWR